MRTNPPTDSELDRLYEEHRDLERERARFHSMVAAVQWVIVGIAAGIVVYGLAVLA